MAKSSDKENIFQAEREKKTVTHKENPIRVSADFSEETFQARKKWHDVFKVLKEHKQKTANQDYFPWQRIPSQMKER